MGALKNIGFICDWYAVLGLIFAPHKQDNSHPSGLIILDFSPLSDNYWFADRTFFIKPVHPNPRNRKSLPPFCCLGFCTNDRRIDLEYFSKKLVKSKTRYQAFRHRNLLLSTGRWRGPLSINCKKFKCIRSGLSLFFPHSTFHDN